MDIGRLAIIAFNMLPNPRTVIVQAGKMEKQLTNARRRALNYQERQQFGDVVNKQDTTMYMFLIADLEDLRIENGTKILEKVGGVTETWTVKSRDVSMEDAVCKAMVVKQQ